MSSPLNPSAAPFIPSKYTAIEEDDAGEESISQEDLDEIEAAEEWVALQAGIEEAEAQFLIDLAVELAEPTRLAEVERSAARPEAHK